ncbi:hypothetical protein IQ216_00145 [Cyanobium sp. LEGE 06143]|nr:hypothetical protein [Cyanobium sp. LEGE 06143]
MQPIAGLLPAHALDHLQDGDAFFITQRRCLWINRQRYFSAVAVLAGERIQIGQLAGNLQPVAQVPDRKAVVDPHAFPP